MHAAKGAFICPSDQARAISSLGTLAPGRHALRHRLITDLMPVPHDDAPCARRACAKRPGAVQALSCAASPPPAGASARRQVWFRLQVRCTLQEAVGCTSTPGRAWQHPNKQACMRAVCGGGSGECLAGPACLFTTIGHAAAIIPNRCIRQPTVCLLIDSQSSS